MLMKILWFAIGLGAVQAQLPPPIVCAGRPESECYAPCEWNPGTPGCPSPTCNPSINPFPAMCFGPNVKGNATQNAMPYVHLKPEYVSSRSPEANGSIGGSYFVFLQKFPLGGVNLFFHTEVLVCPRGGFTTDDQKFLDEKISNIGKSGFLQIDDSWWRAKSASCVELGYGGAECEEECCGVPHGEEQSHYLLKERRAVIDNADGNQKTLYIYGTGSFDGNTAWHNACDKKCWSDWAGTDYNPLWNNCNTFTSTILYCVYGLSEKKPKLGPSDMVTVHGHCPSDATVVV